MSLRDVAWMFLAGGLGASVRVALVPVLDQRITWIPFGGTLLVNLAGCFLIGLLSVGIEGSWRPVVLGGFLGGFTTYSAFGLLGVELLAGARWLAFAAQVTLHVLGGLAAVAAGLGLGRAVFQGPPFDAP